MTDAMTRALRVIYVWANNDALEKEHVMRICKEALESQPAPAARVPDDWEVRKSDDDSIALLSPSGSGFRVSENSKRLEDRIVHFFLKSLLSAPQPPEQEPGR